MSTRELSEQLLKAVEYGDVEKSRILIFEGADINYCDKSGWNSLMLACIFCDGKFVGELIKAGADVNHKDAQGQTALMKATSRGNLEVVSYLLENGAKVDARDNDGWTALMKASFLDDEKIMEKLIDYGADIRATDGLGNSVANLATDKYIKIMILTKIRDEEREKQRKRVEEIKRVVLETIKGMFSR